MFFYVVYLTQSNHRGIDMKKNKQNIIQNKPLGLAGVAKPAVVLALIISSLTMLNCSTMNNSMIRDNGGSSLERAPAASATGIPENVTYNWSEKEVKKWFSKLYKIGAGCYIDYAKKNKLKVFLVYKHDDEIVEDISKGVYKPEDIVISMYNFNFPTGDDPEITILKAYIDAYERHSGQRNEMMLGFAPPVLKLIQAQMVDIELDADINKLFRNGHRDMFSNRAYNKYDKNYLGYDKEKATVIISHGADSVDTYRSYNGYAVNIKDILKNDNLESKIAAMLRSPGLEFKDFAAVRQFIYGACQDILFLNFSYYKIKNQGERNGWTYDDFIARADVFNSDVEEAEREFNLVVEKCFDEYQAKHQMEFARAIRQR